MNKINDILNNYPPMLFYSSAPFDSEDYIYELKLDGMRCLSYIGPEVVLKSRNGRNITALFPELSDIYKCVKNPCVLDGELIILKESKPHLGSILKRNSRLTASRHIEIPVQYVVFDVLWLNGDITHLPLMARKKLLSENVSDGHNLSVIRYTENNGKIFFDLVKSQNLEGIVAKRKNGLYYPGRRTREWFKFKK